jgi:hypothetical protein
MDCKKDIWGIGTFNCHDLQLSIQWTNVTCFFLNIFLSICRELDLPTSICKEAMIVLDLDDPSAQMHACKHKAILFKKIMLMVFGNIVIVQHQDTLWYAVICGVYQSQIQKYIFRWLCVPTINNAYNNGCYGKMYYPKS